MFFTSKLFGQTSYKGFIGKFPIELVTHIYSDGDARAIYTYTNFDNPIIINGRLEKTNLDLFEKDTQGNITATFTFENFDAKSNVLTGSWQNLKTKKTYQIFLSSISSFYPYKIIKILDLHNNFFDIH